MAESFQRIGFIGAGRTCAALAIGLMEAGYQVSAVASRSYESAQALSARLPGCHACEAPPAVLSECEIVFLTVPDDAITPLASTLPWRKGQAVVHCSGVLSTEALSAAQVLGALAGCIHPLQTFASRERGAELLAGSTFAIDGDNVLLEWLREAVQRLGGRAVRIQAEDRPLYHASAVMACGYLTTLLDAASGLWEGMGFSREAGLQALLPLVEGTVAHLKRQGVTEGATGPVIRGDIGTILAHLETLEARTPEVAPLYCQLGLSMVALAEERGAIGDKQVIELRDLFQAHLAKGLVFLPT